MDVIERKQRPAGYRLNLTDSGYYYDKRPQDTVTEKLIAGALHHIFADARLFTPARIGNRKVIALYSPFFEQFWIIVKDGKMSLDKRNVMVNKGTAFRD